MKRDDVKSCVCGVDGSVNIRKGEWLDDLVMVHELILRPSNPYADLVELLPRIHIEIMDLYHEIYDGNNSVSDMAKAWQMRKHSTLPQGCFLCFCF